MAKLAVSLMKELRLSEDAILSMPIERLKTYVEVLNDLNSSE